ncbi:YHYH protein [Aquicoccus sp. SU-CL01552]|uniref:YHYH protein n=1 Tax=Aquicoccus sp. SU-CL01552 TaxID=3127656 RepID=UPI00310BA90D
MRGSLPFHPVSILLQLLTSAAPAEAHPDHAAFDTAPFKAPLETTLCTLRNGAETTCYKITVGYKPEGLPIGPFCPATLKGSGGIWPWDGENAGLYRIDERFLRMMDDLGYRFFDDDGTVYTIDNATSRPEQEHACINVTPDQSVTITMLLPTTPVIADRPRMLGTVGKVGVALDGAPILSDAPSIQSTGHMPALDVCGGHVDPGGWYHWHATATDIETVFEIEGIEADCALLQDSAAMFGYAFDGFPIYGSREADGSVPQDLDACHSHVGATEHGLTYHYHASAVFPNLPPCLVGETALDNFVTTARAGIGSTPPSAPDDIAVSRLAPPKGEPGALPPGFDEAAAALGITPEALMQAIGAAGGPGADLDEVAQRLGVDADALRKTLPQPQQR